MKSGVFKAVGGDVPRPVGAGQRGTTHARGPLSFAPLLLLLPWCLAVDGSRGVERSQRTAMVGVAQATRETLGSGWSLGGARPPPPFGFLPSLRFFLHSALGLFALTECTFFPRTASLVSAVKRQLKEKKAISCLLFS